MTATTWVWLVTLASVGLALWAIRIIERGSRLGWPMLVLSVAAILCGSISLWSLTGVFA